MGTLLAEQHHGWQVGRTYFRAESLARLSTEVAPLLALAADEAPGGAAAPPGG